MARRAERGWSVVFRDEQLLCVQEFCFLLLSFWTSNLYVIEKINVSLRLTRRVADFLFNVRKVFFGIWLLCHRSFQPKIKGKTADSVYRSLQISIRFYVDMVVKLVLKLFLYVWFYFSGVWNARSDQSSCIFLWSICDYK